jgi:hypothetical protein
MTKMEKWVRDMEQGLRVPLGTEAAIFFRERELLERKKSARVRHAEGAKHE